MTGRELAEQVTKEFGTRKVWDIARDSGLSIRFGQWAAVTAGELDLAGKEITINERATIAQERVIAHELGHYFIVRKSIDCTDTEKFCDDFANAITAET